MWSGVTEVFRTARATLAEGLLNKRDTFVVAPGGVYDAGTATESFDFVAPYLWKISDSLVSPKSAFIQAGGVAGIHHGKIDRATHSFYRTWSRSGRSSSRRSLRRRNFFLTGAVCMKIVALIARILLGLVFLVFGLNGFLHFIPQGPLPTGTAGQFVGALFASHYVIVISLLEVIPAILLLMNRYVRGIVPAAGVEGRRVSFLRLTRLSFSLYCVVVPGSAGGVAPGITLGSGASFFSG
jgi:hypothetical protein